MIMKPFTYRQSIKAIDYAIKRISTITDPHQTSPKICNVMHTFYQETKPKIKINTTKYPYTDDILSVSFPELYNALQLYKRHHPRYVDSRSIWEPDDKKSRIDFLIRFKEDFIKQHQS